MHTPLVDHSVVTDAPVKSAPGRSRAKRIFLWATVLVFGPLIVEGASSAWLLASDFRGVEPPPRANFRQAAYDSLLGWKSSPNLAITDNFGPGLSLTTNEDGIRVHRALGVPAPGEVRVMCSGASFTFGSGVKDGDTFCAQLENELPGVRTINVAQQGYGFDQSYLLYKRDGGRYPHRLELFVINATDFERTALSSLTGYPKPGLAVQNGALVATRVPVAQWTGWSRWTEAPRFLPSLRLVQFMRDRMPTTEEAQHRRVDAQLWPVLEPMLRDVIRLNTERGSTPVLVYLPTVEEYASPKHDVRRERLLKSAKEAGMASIDLTPDLRAVDPDSVNWMFISPNQLPVRGNGGHYTAAGNRWVANRLATHLREQPAIAAILSPSRR